MSGAPQPRWKGAPSLRHGGFRRGFEMRSRHRLRRLQVGKELVAFLFGEGRDFAEAVSIPSGTANGQRHRVFREIQASPVRVEDYPRNGVNSTALYAPGRVDSGWPAFVIDAKREVTDLPIVRHLSPPHQTARKEPQCPASHEGDQVGHAAASADWVGVGLPTVRLREALPASSSRSA